MSVANALQKNIVSGDGVNDTFAFTFPITTAADVKLFKQDASADSQPGQIRPVTGGFTVTPNLPNSTKEIVGGTVKYPNSNALSKLQVGEKLIIIRAVTPDQQLTLKTTGSFSGQAQEAEFDKLTMIVQDHAEQISRAVKYTVDQSPTTTDIDGLVANVVTSVLGTAIRKDTFAALDAVAQNEPFLAIILGDPHVIGLYLGDRTLGDNGWAFLGGY